MKKLKKTFVSLAAALTLVFISIVSSNAAGSYFLSDGFYYGVQNNEASVHGYEGQDQDVVIREKFLSYYVTAIDEFAFSETRLSDCFRFMTRLISGVSVHVPLRVA